MAFLVSQVIPVRKVKKAIMYVFGVIRLEPFGLGRLF